MKKAARFLRHKFPSLVFAAGAAVAVPAQAMDLLEAFARAQAYDPAYQAAKADRAVNEADVMVAKFAYLPTASANYGRDVIENRDRTTFQISQPVFDLQKFATWRESSPRAVLAEVNFIAKEQDLAMRVARVVMELVRTRETVRLAQEQINALSQQAVRSQRRFELGQGTVTEASTAQVRLEQAKAGLRQSQAQLAITEKQFRAIVGVTVPNQGFALRRTPARFSLAQVDTLMDQTLRANVLVLQSHANERLAELAKQKSTAAYLPQVNAVARSTRVDGNTNTYTGMQLSIPLGISASNFADRYKAAVAVDRAREIRRDVEEKQKLEIERMWALVSAGLEELPIREAAVRAAELSAEGNVKSFEAGVVSAVDVLNAILVVFEVKREQLNLVAGLVESYLTMQMTAAEPPVEALRRVQAALLEVR